MSSILNKSNLPSNSFGRMGHGLGLQLTKPSSIMHNDKTILKENILITKDGYELLTSRTPQLLPIIN